VRSGFNRSEKIAAVTAFEPILERLDLISDPRRAQGKRFEQRYVLLFAILAIVTGADSYRGIHTFIKVHLKRLDKAFALGWKKPPAHTSIRSILSGLDAADVETAFRSHSADLGAASRPGEAQCRVVAIDGKVLRGSFDAFHDGAARQILSAFAAGTALTIAHIEIDVKSNEIPAAQQLLAELDLDGRIVTLDAMHCQKNIRDCKGKGRGLDRPAQGEPEVPAQAG
jgi:hypothetical protein